MEARLTAILFAFSFLIFLSCDPDLLYKDSQKIEEDQWSYNQDLIFDIPEISDTTATLYLDVSHTKDYRYQNVYVKINESRVVSVQLADNTGAWLGSCGSRTCVQSKPIYMIGKGEEVSSRIRITQHTRDSILSGISSIGVTVRRK